MYDAADVLRQDLNSVLARIGLMRGRVIERTSCPIDIARLRAFRLTAEANELPRDRFGRIRPNARSLGEIARDFLLEVSGDGDGKDGMETTSTTGHIAVEYRHSLVGEALMEAGHITGSRAYAKGADPFKLPKKLRNMALARIGLDFDDDGSHPRASAYLLRKVESWLNATLIPRAALSIVSLSLPPSVRDFSLVRMWALGGNALSNS